jgi:hypothetical protein
MRHAPRPLDSVPRRDALAALRHRSSRVRAAAAVALGRRRDPRAIEALIERFPDRRDVRTAAVHAVSRFGAAAVQPLLAALGRDDAAVRAGALLALGHLRRKPVIPILVEHLTDRRSVIRFAARRALLAFGPATAPVLATFLNRPSVRIRTGVIAVLREFRAVGELVGALGNPSPRTRADAAEALGMIRPAAALSPLVRLLGQDPDSRVRHAAACALLELGDARAMFALRRAARTLGLLHDPVFRDHASEVFGRRWVTRAAGRDRGEIRRAG